MSLDNTDERLFEWIKEDDESAFEILFKKYFGRLCDYARTFVKSTEAAEEIVQEMFIRLWENRSTIQIDASVKSYLFRSVHNSAINQIKRHMAESQRMEEYFEFIRNHFDQTKLEQLISSDYESQFRRSLETLPQQCREVFLLSREQGMNYSQIAESLHLSVNSVKTQMKRALKKLREALGHDFGK